ncbi:hypothetical protein KU43P_07010 [Pseudomonas sp. KU43P]|nr:hypothetical protein KU43P_07010 [Pseudomonas sp. KU43P]
MQRSIDQTDPGWSQLPQSLCRTREYILQSKECIGADADSGLVHHVHGTVANVADVTEVARLHGAESVACAGAGYTGVEKRPEHEGRPAIWQIDATQHLQALEQTQCAHN